MSVTLTPAKQEKIHDLGNALVLKRSVPIRDLAVFIGNVVASSYGVPRAPLRFKYLEIVKTKALHFYYGKVNFNLAYDQLVLLDTQALGLIQWWCDNIFQLTNFISVPPIDLVLVTDAATGHGWGAHMGTVKTYGHWSAHEKDVEHCNLLELKAILFGLQSLCKDVSGSHIRIRSDNMSAVACINKCGSIREALLVISIEIFDWAESHNAYLSAAHIRGIHNTEADELSRNKNLDTEWSVPQSLFVKLCAIFGRPEVDMFASRINAKLGDYFSWHPDPSSLVTDAFSVDWHEFYGYALPPFRLLGRVMQKIIKDRATVLVVLPLWPTKPWFPIALQLLTATPRLISKGSLYLPQDPSLKHRLEHSLVLGALRLSGIPSLREEFRRGLRTSSLGPGDWGRDSSIGRISGNGLDFVVEGALVHFAPL